MEGLFIILTCMVHCMDSVENAHPSMVSRYSSIMSQTFILNLLRAGVSFLYIVKRVHQGMVVGTISVLDE